jgi:hypothetical protein
VSAFALVKLVRAPSMLTQGFSLGVDSETGMALTVASLSRSIILLECSVRLETFFAHLALVGKSLVGPFVVPQLLGLGKELRARGASMAAATF